MLRLTRVPVHSSFPLRRLPLHRLASTAHAPSTAPSAYTTTTPPPAPPYPLRPRISLYATPTLPPLPAPLPLDASSYDSPTSVPKEASTHEQLAVLDACLASGDVGRAEEIINRITTSWLRKTAAGRDADTPHVFAPPSLSDLLPPSTHTGFLRAYLLKALSPAEVDPEVTSKSRLQGVYVRKAWAYWDTLASPHFLRNAGTREERNGAVDAGVIAVLLKGLIALGKEWYDPTEGELDAGARPITRLLNALQRTNVSLEAVMRHSVWASEEDKWLGTVSWEQGLDALKETGRSQGVKGWEGWEEKIESVRAELKKEQEAMEARAPEVEVQELVPTQSKDKQTTSTLQNLRENLASLRTPESRALSPTERQRALEESSYDAAQQLYIHEMAELAKVGRDKEGALQTTWLQTVMFEWMRKLEARLIEDSKDTSGKKSVWGKEPDIDPFLRLLKPDKMALITIVELLRLSGAGGVSDGMKSTRAIIHIGKAIESEYHAEVLKSKHPSKEFTKDLEHFSDFSASGSKNPKRGIDLMWQRDLAVAKENGDLDTPPEWTQTIRSKVGAILVAALSEVATVERKMTLESGEEVTEIQPAFSHAYQYVRSMKLGVIKINPVVAEKMEADPLRITLHPRFLPMVVKPKIWTAWNQGSYLRNQTKVMRTKDSREQIDYLKQASDAGSLDKIFEGLDVLGSLAWKINRPVFDIVSEVWNTGEAFADIPIRDSLTRALDAEKPDNVETDPRARDTYRQRVRKALQERRAAHSNRCDVNYKLEIGRAFLGEKFYFPHNLDFRGRAYPIPPNLSHIGNDLCRGILMFDEAKPLGERGLRWLKIHLANMAGYDKASFDEREAYAMEHLEDVFDSADNPLGGQRWWLKAEDPWQCLATCFELAAALRAPVPIEFMSSLPVHQDGTCNGLQHYAALGGDLDGAHQVNLDGGDRPADVYSGVARMANEVIDRDVLAGNEYAKMLQGKVTRKVVKQTVMTTVYGVTFIGAKKQIAKQLKERGDIPIEHLYMCSLYLGRIVLDSIGDVFKGATAIQTWLNRSARLIAKSIPAGRVNAATAKLKVPKSRKKVKPGEEPVAAPKTAPSRIAKEQMVTVVWTTPLGLPVAQPYRKPKKRQVSTVLQTVYIVDPTIPAEVDARAQATAFPPNFIHSLDATHMMMTALQCKDKIAFASVHDSYWTHACSVDEMSYILRDSFIELHSQDILGKLREEFIQRYAGNEVPVSKVPAGIRYRVQVGDTLVERVATAGAPGVTAGNPLDILQDLEREDGDVLTPLFKSPAKVKRVKDLAQDPAWLDGADSDDGALESETEAFQNSAKTATGSKASFVPLADILPPVPARGTFDLERIRDSLYFFS